MRIEQRSPDDVKPYERNPRVNDTAVDAVAASLKEFGFRQPIVVDEAGVIVVGHTRWKAAKRLGLDKVPVHVAKDLTPEQAKACPLADNRTADIAEWDIELLPIELRELKELDIDLSLLGFGEIELDELPADPDVDEPDPANEVPEASVVSEPRRGPGGTDAQRARATNTRQPTLRFNGMRAAVHAVLERTVTC
jgi:ParB-like chromosome segregation protein Spo0J